MIIIIIISNVNIKFECYLSKSARQLRSVNIKQEMKTKKLFFTELKV